MATERYLNAAAKAKKDEFYTLLSDIEKELYHYKKHFAGKTVLCNCDDPFESNFFKYFVLNFNRLGIKKLIATCYASSQIANTQLSIYDVLGKKEKIQNKPYKAIVTTVYDKTGDGGVDMIDVAELFISGENTLTELKGDGDFRSDECIELLEECDIVVTNPPFSLFREYINLLIQKNKNFIVLGNQNALTYKDFFPLIKDNKIWIGYGFNLSLVYKTPYPNELEANRQFVISRGYSPEDGYVKVPGIAWFTNLDIKKRHEKMILVKHYSPEEYPYYYNYTAINIDKITDIPCDYEGIMGVPITFMDKYSPDQFEIIGLGIANLGLNIGVHPYTQEHKKYRKEIQKRGVVDGDLYMIDENNNPVVPYARVLIRNKHPEQSKGEAQ